MLFQNIVKPLKNMTKSQFKQLALQNGYEARYSGITRTFYMHPINPNPDFKEGDVQLENGKYVSVEYEQKK